MAGSGTGTQATAVSTVTISVDAWFDDVVPAASLCPNPVIRKEIVRTCRDICRRTLLWVVQLAAIDVVALQEFYDLAAVGAEVVGADRAEYDGKPMNPVSEMALDEDETETEYWRTRTIETPERYFVTEQYKFRPVYIPDAALVGGLVVWANVMPLETATAVPLFLYNEFRELVKNGAIGRLKMILDMPWTDLTAGAGFLDVYEQMMTPAMQKKYTGFQRVKTRDIIRTRFQDF